MTTLQERRKQLALAFAQSSVTSQIGKEMFPENKNLVQELRHKEKYFVKHCYTNRMKKSAIPYMTTLLNEDWNNKEKFKLKI